MSKETLLLEMRNTVKTLTGFTNGLKSVIMREDLENIDVFSEWIMDCAKDIKKINKELQSLKGKKTSSPRKIRK